MYALTVKQPWAWAIMRGLKGVENRTWEPAPAAVGQLVALHAGKAFDKAGYADFGEILRQTGASLPEMDVYQYGAVIAVARLKAVVKQSPSPWFFGPFGWVLSDVVALPVPVPCRGALGLWQLPPAAESAVMRGMGEAQMRREIWGRR